MEDVEHGKESLESLANDEVGAPSYDWNNMDVGEPIRGRTKERHGAAKKVYDMFKEHEVGPHFGRSGSPKGAEKEEEMED